MALPDAPSPQRLLGRIDLQDDLGDLAPIGAVDFSVEQAQIRNEVLLIVPCQNGFGWSQVGDGRVERRLLHTGTSPQPKSAVNNESYAVPHHRVCAPVNRRNAAPMIPLALMA
jgi:hypothetical protein